MKHIKSYENLSFELKKYAVWKWDHYNEYDIIEITDKTDDNDDIIWCRDIYSYTPDDGIKFLTAIKSASFSISMYGHCVIYTSDDLDDCLEYLKMVSDFIKYNL
jgi:hypothetical protein